MLKRITPVALALIVLAAYAGLYLLGWWNVERVPEDERDGMEWLLMAALTPPWCLFAGAFGLTVVHAGAVVNGTLLAGVAGWNVRRRLTRTGG